MKKLTVRDLTVADLPILRELHVHNADFPLPDLSNFLYCCNKAVVDPEGCVVGVGLVRLTSEAILIMDKSSPNTVQSRAVKQLFDALRSEVSRLGMDETHCFVEAGSKLENFLRRAFGFVTTKTRALYLQF